MRSSRPSYTLVNLASAFLAGPWTRRSLVNRGCRACPHRIEFIRTIVRHLLSAFGEPPALDALLAFLDRDPAVAGSGGYLLMGQCFWLPGTMTPRGGAAESWKVPSITSIGQLAARLGVTMEHLDWLADIRGLTVKQSSPKFRHYVCHWQPRKQGRFRLIESPKPRLKAIQQLVLREILDQIPPHESAHGFRKGRSILTYAAPHAGRHIVLRFDLRDFFPSVPSCRIHALFRTAGYPDEVARAFTGLCTTRMPPEIWDSRPDPRDADARLGNRLRGSHLPQGAPTSPALANLCSHRLDVRLHALAESAGAVYTRYADDLAFSGGERLACSARRFQTAVAVIAEEEGFTLHFQKSRFMRRGVRQQLAGIIVNQVPNLRRAIYDELKAILTNCLRYGPESQNRAGHSDFRANLLGRIAYLRMIHPTRGAKMQQLFDRIGW